MDALLFLLAAAYGEAANRGDLTPERWQWRDDKLRIVATLWHTPSEQVQPLITLCPGRGTAAASYSQLAEALVARGLAVLAVDIPHVGRVAYSDGSTVLPSDAFRPSFELITGPYEKVDQFFEPAVDIGMAAWKLALQRLESEKPESVSLEIMGAVGHSLGGRICGALVAHDRRFVAYATMEGVPPRSVRRAGMKAASLQMYSSELPEDMALPNIRELYDNARGPSVLVRLEGFGHNSITDGPLKLPDSYGYGVDPARAHRIYAALIGGFLESAFGDQSFHVPAFEEITVKESSP